MRIRSQPPKIFDIVKKDCFFLFGSVWIIFTSIIFAALIRDIVKNKDILGHDAILVYIYSIFFTSIGILMIYFPLSRAILIKYLHKNGRPAKATVTKITVTVETDDKPSHCSVKYNFKYVDNRQYEGKTGLVPIKNTDSLKKGDIINILYSPNNPKKTIWIDGYC